MEPTQDSDHSTDPDFKVRINDEFSQDSNLTLSVNGPESFTDKTQISPDQEWYNWTNLDIGTNSYGTYEFSASSDNGNISEDSVSGVLVDEANPSVDSRSPIERISDSSPTVEVSGIDSASDVVATNISVSGNGVDEFASGESSANIDLSGLSDGVYDVSYNLKDTVGNTASDSWTFTVDTSYDGDTSPTVSPGPQVFRMEGGDDLLLLNVELEGRSEESEIKVTCEYQGGVLAGTAFHDVPEDGSETYDCDMNPMEFMNMGVDLSLKMEDEAGNSASESIGTYYFDFTPPEFGNLSTVVGVFNSDFQVSYDANDVGEGLEVARIHYQVDEPVLDMESGVNVSEVDGDFQVDTEALSSGEHTVYAWAVDRAGRVSEVSSLDFDFRPSADPKASISVDQDMSVPAGDSKTIRSNVSNRGQILIGEMELKLSSDIANRSRTIRELKPGEKTDAIYNIDTTSEDLGVHTVELSTESPDASETIRFVVEANNEQEKKITNNYNDYFEKYKALEENVTDLKNSGLSDDRKEDLEANTSEFFSDMKAAKRAKESGDLYEVENHLRNISDDYKTASASYDSIKKQHEKAEWNQTVGLFLLIFIALGGSGLAYVSFFSDRYYVDLQALQEEFEFLEAPIETVQTTLDQYEISLEPLENAVENLSELIAEEEEEIEEAEQQAFQGFT